MSKLSKILQYIQIVTIYKDTLILIKTDTLKTKLEKAEKPKKKKDKEKKKK